MFIIQATGRWQLINRQLIDHLASSFSPSPSFAARWPPGYLPSPLTQLCCQGESAVRFCHSLAVLCLLMNHSFIWILLFGSMELALPTPVFCPPSLEWCLHTVRHTLGAKAREGGQYLWWVYWACWWVVCWRVVNRWAVSWWDVTTPCLQKIVKNSFYDKKVTNFYLKAFPLFIRIVCQENDI